MQNVQGFSCAPPGIHKSARIGARKWKHHPYDPLATNHPTLPRPSPRRPHPRLGPSLQAPSRPSLFSRSSAAFRGFGSGPSRREPAAPVNCRPQRSTVSGRKHPRPFTPAPTHQRPAQSTLFYRLSLSAARCGSATLLFAPLPASLRCSLPHSNLYFPPSLTPTCTFLPQPR